MTSKKAIIIVLIIFLIMVAALAFLYLKSQSAGLENEPIGARIDGGQNGSASSTNQAELSPAQRQIKAIEDKTEEQVEKIVEQGKTASGGITADAQRKIEAAVNREIMEKIKLKNSEQIKKDRP